MNNYGEPWERESDRIVGECIQEACGNRVVMTINERYSERIVACVNACAGLSDEDLKAVPHVRELLEALEGIASQAERMREVLEAMGKTVPNGHFARAYSVISLAKGN